jgi:dTMP kinase
MRQAWFISFEGIDGAGKSTHIEGLAQWFKSRGHVVTLTREPGGTPLAEKFRALALHESMDPLTEALLMFAARREHLINVIEPALGRFESTRKDGANSTSQLFAATRFDHLV